MKAAIKSAFVTAAATVRAEINTHAHGIYYVAGSVAGEVLLRNGTAAGAIVAVIGTPAGETLTETVNFPAPIRATDGLYVDPGAAEKVTVFYD